MFFGASSTFKIDEISPVHPTLNSSSGKEEKTISEILKRALNPLVL